MIDEAFAGCEVGEHLVVGTIVVGAVRIHLEASARRQSEKFAVGMTGVAVNGDNVQSISIGVVVVRQYAWRKGLNLRAYGHLRKIGDRNGSVVDRTNRDVDSL